MEESNYTYFQYFKGHALPVYIRLNKSSFQKDLVDLIKSLKFNELSSEESEKMLSDFSGEQFGKILTIDEASPGVMRQIGLYSESDQFGSESIHPKESYNVYRYRGVALMIYGHSFKEWEMGCVEDFGSEGVELATKVILMRFLSWSLAPLGVIGIWGVPVDEGMVVQKPSEAGGEVVFIDVFKRTLYTQDGQKKMKSSFKLLKLDSSLRDRSIKMGPEQFLTFLSAHCSYFSFGGMTIPTRQMIQSICRTYEGLVYPAESFQPRTDLNL
ncbi:hypothetical protein [Halobacteriovorax sp.]|uniref:hypothetical protein n=1 Tax=Halobacteriovorax sp. TaxID=2020862 RepID=UPI0035697B47